MKNKAKIAIAVIAVAGVVALVMMFTQKNEETTTTTSGGSTTRNTQGLGGLLGSIIPLFGNKKVTDNVPVTTPDDNKADNNDDIA